MRYAILLFTLVAAAFMAIGANSAVEQKERLSAARPTPGIILSSEVHEISSTDTKNRKTEQFRPIVRYQYRLGNSIISSDKVFPVASTTSRKRAEDVVAKYQPGKAVTVWYVPNAPEFLETPKESFLVREWDFSPYLVILCAMVFLSFGVGMWSANPRRRRFEPAAQPQASADNWRAVPIKGTLAQRRRPWRAATLVWFVIGGIAVGHYFVHADRPYSWESLIATPIYCVLGLIPLFTYFAQLRTARLARDARLWVNTDAFRVGKTFNVKIEQQFRKPATIETARLELICDKTDRVPNRAGKLVTMSARQFETADEVATNRAVSPAQPLEIKTKLTPPADQPPTTPDMQRGLPRHVWRIALTVKIAGRPDYTAEFPIVVVGAA